MTLKAWCVLAKLYGYRLNQGELLDTVWYAWDGKACKGAWLNSGCCLYKPGKHNSLDTLVVNK